MTIPSDLYTYRVSWLDEDKEFVGTCAEFPGLSWLEADADAAFRGIRDLVQETVEDMAASGEAIPEPISLRPYSGKFQVRTTPEVHRRLTIEAAKAKVSLNRLVNSKLLG